MTDSHTKRVLAPKNIEMNTTHIGVAHSYPPTNTGAYRYIYSAVPCLCWVVKTKSINDFEHT